jgi:hypothetical protein
MNNKSNNNNSKQSNFFIEFASDGIAIKPNCIIAILKHSESTTKIILDSMVVDKQLNKVANLEFVVTHPFKDVLQQYVDFYDRAKLR